MIYRVFMSKDGDWHIAAKCVDGAVTVLFEGHSSEQAYEAILEDMGVSIPFVEKDMSDGGYDPTPPDWD